MLPRSHFERYKIPHVASFEAFNLIFLLCCPYGLKTKPIEIERERASCQLRQVVRQSRPNLKDRLQSLFLEILIKKEENRPLVPLKKSLFLVMPKRPF